MPMARWNGDNSMMEYPYGYCGMPCALCTRCRTDGKSRCPGCSHDGYYTDVCKAHHCCRQRGVGHCGACPDFPCARLGKMGDFKDLDTGHVKQRTCAAVAAGGFEKWYREYTQRADLLTAALTRYNDGRRKRFLCELFIKAELPALQETMARAEALAGDPKELAKAFQQLASEVLQERAPR